MKLYQGDCLEIMQTIPNDSVDLLLVDLPYGTTKCPWDIPIAFTPMWEQIKRIRKCKTAILFFSVQPFTSDLINSNRKEFRYELIWEKTQKTGYLNANRMPMKAHENICVFYSKLPIYNPQKISIPRKDIGRKRDYSQGRTQQYGAHGSGSWIETGTRYPGDVLSFSNWNGALFGNTNNAALHPTQKPIALLEWLIKTYSYEGDVVLDFTMGSGSTGVACANTGRDFIGVEKDAQFFSIAQERIGLANHQAQSV